MKKHELQHIFIYGIFKACGACVYIGQTINPEPRLRTHCSSRGKFNGFNGEVKMRILRRTNSRDASRLERQIGMAYRKRGQALESKVWSAK